MVSIKKIFCVVFLFVFCLCAECLAQFSKNIIVYDDGVYVEGGGRILNFGTGLSVTYNETTGMYTISGSAGESGGILCDDPGDQDVCIVYSTGIATFYVLGEAQWRAPIETGIEPYTLYYDGYELVYDGYTLTKY